MKTIFHTSLVVICLASVMSCKVQQNTAVVSTPSGPTDLVCGMKVDKSEAYTSKYNGKIYYFDSYNCKQSFIMNPDKFINNTCAKAENK